MEADDPARREPDFVYEEGESRVVIFIHRGLRVLEGTWSGPLPATFVAKALQAYGPVVAEYADFDRVVDVRTARMSEADQRTIRSWVEAAQRQDEALSVASQRSAYVADSDLNFGLVRMFQSLGARRRMEQNVFRTSAEAWAWLGRDAPSGRA